MKGWIIAYVSVSGGEGVALERVRVLWLGGALWG